MISFVIKGRICGLNELTNGKARGHWSKSAEVKKSEMDFVMWQIKATLKGELPKYPLKLKINYYERDAMRDIDNVFGAGSKIILDSLVKLKIIRDDSQKYVNDLEQHLFVDGSQPRIEVQICTSEKEKAEVANVHKKRTDSSGKKSVPKRRVQRVARGRQDTIRTGNADEQRTGRGNRGIETT